VQRIFRQLACQQVRHAADETLGLWIGAALVIGAALAANYPMQRKMLVCSVKYWLLTPWLLQDLLAPFGPQKLARLLLAVTARTLKPGPDLPGLNLKKQSLLPAGFPGRMTGLCVKAEAPTRQ
jgi:hypothetical protein